jgi:hypothetical protein
MKRNDKSGGIIMHQTVPGWEKSLKSLIWLSFLEWRWLSVFLWLFTGWFLKSGDDWLTPPFYRKPMESMSIIFDGVIL